MKSVKIGNSSNLKLDEVPNSCPYCHKNINPIAVTYVGIGDSLQIVFQCPCDGCKFLFVYDYLNSSYDDLIGKGKCYSLDKLMSPKIKATDFSKVIKELSINFVKIYQQSYAAEQYGLDDICGVGYRKALEFLIKDYLINCNSEEEEIIKSKSLGACIKDMIENEKIKKMAERAVWLGNDETHYVRKWEQKDLTDLKILISVVVHFIEMEIISDSYLEDMN